MSLARPYSSIPYLPNARAIIALEQISARAAEKGDLEVHNLATDALAEHAYWREGIDVWIGQNRSRARAGGEMLAIDGEADYLVRTIYDILEGLTLQRADTPAGQRAARLIAAHFTDLRGRRGAGWITAAIYEEQLPRMRKLHAVLTDDPAQVELLRITQWVAELGEILPRYAAALRTDERIAWDDVLSRRAAAYDALFGVVGMVVARYRHNRETIEYLLAPLNDQITRAADAARRRRAGQAGSEETLTPEELIAAEGVEDLDGDGVVDGDAPMGDGPVSGVGEAMPAAGAAGGGPDNGAAGGGQP